MKTKLFTETPVMRALLKLAFPTVIGQIILVIYNMADTFFIGLAGDDAMLGAVTVCMPAFLFLSAIANLFGIGGASVMAGSLGAGDEEKARNVSCFAFWGTVLLTLCYAAGAFLLRNAYVNLLGGTSAEVHAYALRYLLVTVVFGGIGSSLSITLSHLLRAEGHSVIAAFGISIGGILNILLDPLFMFVLLPAGNEVLGAAIATAVSNLFSLLFFAAVLLSRGKLRGHLSFLPAKKRFSLHVSRLVLTAGLPAAVMTLFENISYAVLGKQVSMYGIAMQAGIGVAKKVNIMAHSIVRGIAQGALPFIAYNYASGDTKRMRRAIRYANVLAIGMALICTLICLSLGSELIGLFIRNASPSRDAGIRFLRILCIGAPFSACAYTCISVFQAVGEGAKSFLLAILRKGIVDIPLMFLLKIFFAETGVVMATPVADALCCVTAIVMSSFFFRPDAGRDMPVEAETDRSMSIGLLGISRIQRKRNRTQMFSDTL